MHSVVTVHGLGEQTLPRGFIINPVIQGALQKTIGNFEDQYPAFNSTKIIKHAQIQHFNQCNFENYQFFPLMTF